MLASLLMLGACAQIGELGLGGAAEPEVAVAGGAEQRPRSELEKATEYWGKEVVKSPRDGKAVLSYAKNLKALGRKHDALNALQSAYVYNGDNREYLSEYGRLALELGQVGPAAALLERADDPARPDWRVVSARGTAMAKQGNYRESIAFFERARELAPGQASVLNNLAMAYTMDGQAEKAEGLLREAARKESPDPKIKQNLALVLSLQGKPAEDGSAPTPAAPGTAPVAAVESKPLDADAVIKAAMEAEAAKSRKPSTAVATGSTPRARKASAAGEPGTAALRTSR